MQWGTNSLAALAVGVMVHFSAWSQDTLLLRPAGFGLEHQLYSPATGSTPWQAWTYSHLEGGSNTLPSGFLNRLISGGQITQELKDEGFDQMAARNQLGYTWTNGVGVQHSKSLEGGKARTLWLRMENTDLARGQFSRDLYELVFYGNAQFEDRTTNLDDTRIFWQNTNTIQGGMARQWQRGVLVHEAAAGIGIVQGNRFGEGHLDGTFYTAPGGEWLEVDLRGSLAVSDTSWAGMVAMRGWGASLDAQYAITSPASGWTAQVQAGVNSPIRWWDGTLGFEVEAQRDFYGIHIHDLLSGDGSSFGFGDSLSSYIDTIAYPNGYTTNPEARLLVMAGRTWNSRSLHLGVRYTTAYWPGPQLFARYQHEWEKLQGGMVATASAGGYAPWSAGLGLYKQFGQRATFTLGTNHVAALAFNNRLPGTSYYALLAVQF